MTFGTTLFHLAIALGLGLLVGIQREHVAARLGGVRTFPLITLLGSLCGLISQYAGGWVIGAGFIALAGIIIIGNFLEIRKGGEIDPGITTEVAMLVMFGIGAYLMLGQREVAVTLGACVAILLHLKSTLHSATSRLSETDLRAIMQFALISMIILPVLPDKTYGPFNVLNPRNIWLMVVLIVGISLTGYIAYKFFESDTGILLSGILGGLISSTATTVSYSRKSKSQPSISSVAAVVIAMACAILYLRVLVEVLAVSPELVRAAAGPLLILGALLAATAAWFWFREKEKDDEQVSHGNPSELKSALVFGLIYAAVLLAVAAVKKYLGDRALYLVAIISGLTDVDAITLSVSRLVSGQTLSITEGWRLIVTASLANLAFKTAFVAVLGDKSLIKRLALPFFAVILAGLAMIWLWPA